MSPSRLGKFDRLVRGRQMAVCHAGKAVCRLFYRLKLIVCIQIIKRTLFPVKDFVVAEEAFQFDGCRFG